MDADILCLIETHIKGDDYVNIDGYTDIREVHQVRACKSYRGIAILIKNELCNHYSVEVVDKSSPFGG